MTPQAAYDELVQRSREATLIASCQGLLEWDESTYLPPAGVAHRSRQMALLSGLQHQRASDPRLGELLEVLEGSDLVKNPDSSAAANVREIRREFDRSRKLPRTLVEEISRVTALAQYEWEVARRESNFGHFRPWLEKVFRLKREEAQAVRNSGSLYDALLEEYESELREEHLVGLFAELGRELTPLLTAVAGAPNQPRAEVLQRQFPTDRQRILGEIAAAVFGFDFRAGRLDTAVHPFCTSIGPGDCRLTARYRPDRFNDGFFAILHEVGHGLYEQGLPAEHYGTPRGEAASLSLHESQARLWENLVGRSRAFWDHFFPTARALFPEALHDVSADEFHFAVNEVRPSFNRVVADEVTYNFHIAIRFDLERALLTGDLSAEDLPAAWNEAYRRVLGVTPPNDAEGCLQDGHWASGLVGYFPTYTLGNVYAAQLFARATEELGDIETEFSCGRFAVLLQWLHGNVYARGRQYPTAQLLTRVTGAGPDHRPFVTRVRRKYEEVYLTRPHVSLVQ